MNKLYRDTVALLIKVAPIVFQTPGFALKGGTAINLFMTDMPRLSVDLDVVLVDYKLDREQAYQKIEDFIASAERNLSKFKDLKVVRRPMAEGDVTFMVVGSNCAVKIEVNPVMRGTIEPVVECSVTKPVEQMFKASLILPVFTKNELYASKFVAALDRQHPRDLFDVHELYRQGGGVTDEMVRNFVGYLAVSPRPIDEVLYPNIKDIKYEYENHFVGMTTDDIPIELLIEARERLALEVQARLSNDHKNFLISLAQGQPDYSLIEIPHLAELPAIRWKVQNLQKFASNDSKRMAMQVDKLKEKFGQTKPFNNN